MDACDCVFDNNDDVFYYKCDWKKYTRKIRKVIKYDYVGIRQTYKSDTMRVYTYAVGENSVVINVRRGSGSGRGDCCGDVGECGGDVVVYSLGVSQNGVDVFSYSSYTARDIYKKLSKLLFGAYYLDGTKVFKSRYF